MSVVNVTPIVAETFPSMLFDPNVTTVYDFAYMFTGLTGATFNYDKLLNMLNIEIPDLNIKVKVPSGSYMVYRNNVVEVLTPDEFVTKYNTVS